MAVGTHVLDVAAQERARRKFVAATCQQQLDRRFEAGQLHLVASQCAVQRVLAQGFDRRSLADQHAGLRAAEQLVPRERHDVDAAGDSGRDLGLAPDLRTQHRGVRGLDQAGAQVPRTGHAVLRAQLGQVGGIDLFGESDDAEVRRMDLHQQACVRADRLGVIADACAVGRADLDQARVGRSHHVGHAERAADLDQLAAADDRLAVLGEGVHAEQRGSSIVVDRDARLGARQAQQQLAESIVAAVALACEPVDLEHAVPGGGGAHALGHLGMDRRATEARVQHDAGHVDHGAHAAALLDLDQAPHGAQQLRGVDALLQSLGVELAVQDLHAPFA